MNQYGGRIVISSDYFFIIFIKSKLLTMSDQIYIQARKRVKQKKKFYKHLAAFVAVGFFFFAMNMYTLVDEGPEIWFFFPLLPWSVGLVIHYLNVFGFPGSGALTPEWEEKQLEKEMRTLRHKPRGAFPSKSTREDALELKDFAKEKRTDWDKGDLV